MPARTIDEVIADMEALISISSRNNDRIGYFAALYHKVTLRVKEGILKNEFDDNARMEKLVVTFANRYLTAIEAYKSGMKPTGCWQVAFDATKRYSVLVLQHLLLGMNAHINLDLGIAAVEVAGNDGLMKLRNDFNSINNILGSLSFEVINDLNRVSPLLSLFGLHAGNNSILIQFSLTNARDGAWAFAEDLAGSDASAREKCIADRDDSIRKLGPSLVNPKGLIKITRWIIWLFEWKSPHKIINQLYAAKKKFIHADELILKKK